MLHAPRDSVPSENFARVTPLQSRIETRRHWAARGVTEYFFGSTLTRMKRFDSTHLYRAFTVSHAGEHRRLATAAPRENRNFLVESRASTQY